MNLNNSIQTEAHIIIIEGGNQNAYITTSLATFAILEMIDLFVFKVINIIIVGVLSS